MVNRPLIALTANLNGTGPLDGTVQCSRAYVEAIAAAGGLPVVLPPPADVAVAAVLTTRVDGILFTGGNDLDPRRYGQTCHAASHLLDPRRETWDLHWLQYVVHHATLPVLGVCLGVQEMNVALGGTLTQHVPDLGGCVEHRAPEKGDRLHRVTVCAGSRLAAMLGSSEVEVTTRHHQGIDRIGQGLVVAARAADGLVEALEWGGAPERFVVGVQWHPERNPDSPASKALFGAFVAACASRPGVVRARRRARPINVERETHACP